MCEQPETIDMNPLSRVRPDAPVGFNATETMQNRPEIAIKIAQCIAEWSEIETVLGMVLALLLGVGTEDKAARAMYSAVESRAAQTRMLMAAAKAALPAHHFEVFMCMWIGFVKPAMKDRDKLAHWGWAYSPALPHAALLVEPGEQLEFHANRLDLTRFYQFKRDHIFVVTEADLERILKRFSQTKDYLGRFGGTLWEVTEPAQRAQYLDALSNEPQIRQCLDRRRKKSSQ
jgi:hypothetical protein